MCVHICMPYNQVDVIVTDTMPEQTPENSMLPEGARSVRQPLGHSDAVAAASAAAHDAADMAAVPSGTASS